MDRNRNIYLVNQSRFLAACSRQPRSSSDQISSSLVDLIPAEEVSQDPSPTYPGVPQAVAITSPVPSIFDRPKSLIMILDSSSGLK